MSFCCEAESMGVEVGVVAGLGSVSEVHLTIYWQKELFESDVFN